MCNICNKFKCDPRCPNSEQEKPLFYCEVCGQGIYKNEEYIENIDCEHIHFDCIIGMRWLINWLGYEVKTDLNI